MNFIETYNWSITIGLILLVIGVIIAGAYFIVWYGKQQAKLANEYMSCYEKIQKVLDYEICPQNCDWIERLFIRLDKCTYKNPEMREVLDNEFKEKYNYIIVKKKVEEMI